MAKPPDKSAEIRAVQLAVCQEYGISLVELLSNRREHVRIRFIAYWLARGATGASWCQLGSSFNKDASTVRDGVGRIFFVLNEGEAQRALKLSCTVKT